MLKIQIVNDNLFEQIAQKSSDIDLVMGAGFGFSRQHGGSEFSRKVILR